MYQHFTLALTQGQVIHCTFHNNQSVTLHHSQSSEPLSFTGIFADAILSLRTDTPNHSILQRIEQAHPSLHGLTQAKRTPKPQELILGDGLGMLFVELTSTCNERCLHCYADSHPERNDFLALDDVTRVLQEARALGRPFVQLTGGDPLIHPKLLDIMASVRELDFAGLEVYTNGLLLHDKLLQRMQDYQPRLSFSLYADNPEIHDAITRVPNSWKRTLNALQKSIQAGFDVRVGVVIMQENAEHIANIPDFLAQNFGIASEHIRFDPVNRVGRGNLTHLPEHIRIESSHATSIGAARQGKLCIAATGHVYPCIFSRQLALGHIQQQSLQDMLACLQYRNRHHMEERWKRCQEQLSCSDCQMVACLLTSTQENP